MTNNKHREFNTEDGSLSATFEFSSEDMPAMRKEIEDLFLKMCMAPKKAKLRTSGTRSPIDRDIRETNPSIRATFKHEQRKVYPHQGRVYKDMESYSRGANGLKHGGTQNVYYAPYVGATAEKLGDGVLRIFVELLGEERVKELMRKPRRSRLSTPQMSKKSGQGISAGE
jgi:hypothetical protein